MVKVLDQFGLQAAIPAVIFSPARPQGLAQLSGSLRVEWEEGELRVLHEGVEQGSARLLRGDVDVAPRAELLDEFEHPVVKGVRRVLDLRVARFGSWFDIQLVVSCSQLLTMTSSFCGTFRTLSA